MPKTPKTTLRVLFIPFFPLSSAVAGAYLHQSFLENENAKEKKEARNEFAGENRRRSHSCIFIRADIVSLSEKQHNIVKQFHYQHPARSWTGTYFVDSERKFHLSSSGCEWRLSFENVLCSLGGARRQRKRILPSVIISFPLPHTKEWPLDKVVTGRFSTSVV